MSLMMLAPANKLDPRFRRSRRTTTPCDTAWLWPGRIARNTPATRPAPTPPLRTALRTIAPEELDEDPERWDGMG